MRWVGLNLGCQLSTVDLQGPRRPATTAKFGHEARILIVHRDQASGRPTAAGGVEKRALRGSVAPSGRVDTLVVFLERTVDLPRLGPHVSGRQAACHAPCLAHSLGRTCASSRICFSFCVMASSLYLRVRVGVTLRAAEGSRG